MFKPLKILVFTGERREESSANRYRQRSDNKKQGFSLLFIIKELVCYLLLEIIN